MSLRYNMTALLSRWRSIALTLVLLGGAAFLTAWVNQFTPLRHWLCFRYAVYFGLAAGLWGSWLLIGTAMLEKALPRRLPLGEHLVCAVALGALSFGLIWFGLGVVGAYSAWTFIGVPALLAVLGIKPTINLFQRYRRHARLWRAIAHPAPGWFSIGLGTLGVLAFALLYLAIVTPDNVAYDARWYHLAGAERYAVQHGIRPYGEGWFLGAYPQFATWLYSWAFSMPKALLFDRIELAMHIEFAGFAYATMSIAVLVRRLIGQGRHGLSWVARFAFPGVFLYDSNIAGGADHLAAIWAIPIYLTLVRALAALDLRYCLLCACFMSGALLTKYSAVGMVAFPAIALCARALWQCIRERSRGWAAVTSLGSVLAMLVWSSIVTAPHWLKNWIWYGDPIYPLAFTWFSPHPWTVDTPDRFGHFIPVEWTAPHTAQGVLNTVKALFTFSFVPNDWPAFHGDVPVFGSLLTLALPALIVLKPRLKLYGLIVCIHVAIASWYWTFHQDRYLQSYLPWMATAVACIAIESWRMGMLPRLGVLALGAAQLTWGGNVPFIPGHVMTAGGSPFRAALDLLSSSYRKDYKHRFDVQAPYSEVHKLVSPDATVLLHEEHVHLGIGLPSISDWVGWQGGISYARTRKPSQMHALFRQLGVTDVLWTPTSRGFDSLAGDIAFFFFVTRFTARGPNVGPWVLSHVRREVPSDAEFFSRALVLGCGDTYASGLYDIGDLTITVLPTTRPRTDFPAPIHPLTPGDPALFQMLSRVDAIVHTPQCFPTELNFSAYDFEEVADRHGAKIWIKRAMAVH